MMHEHENTVRPGSNNRVKGLNARCLKSQEPLGMLSKILKNMIQCRRRHAEHMLWVINTKLSTGGPQATMEMRSPIVS